MQKSKFWAGCVFSIWTIRTNGFKFEGFFIVRLGSPQKRLALTYNSYLASSSYRRSLQMNTTPSGFNLPLDRWKGWPSWHSYLSNAVLAEDRPLTGCLQLLYLQTAATEASLGLCTLLGQPASLSTCSCSLPSTPTGQECTTAQQGPQGSTGGTEAGRSSKFVWGTQIKENNYKVDGRGKDHNLRAAGFLFIQQPGKIHKPESYQFKCSLPTLLFFSGVGGIFHK